jgi:putative hydrolase of HD superfamily
MAMLRALFHDIPESLTGDVITPVKDKINKVQRNIDLKVKEDVVTTWDKVEDTLVEDFVNKIPVNLKKDIETKELLKGLDGPEAYTVDSLVRECDRLALIIECLFEKEYGLQVREMNTAYDDYVKRLQNSEWTAMREYAVTLLLDFPRAGISR